MPSRSDDDGDTPPALRSPTESEGFDEKGHVVPPEAPECVARTLTDVTTGKTRHFVRVAKDGPEPGHFYNPRSIYGKPPRPDAVTRGGNARYAWRAVTETAFDAYQRFLCTGDTTHLRIAERNAAP